MGKRAGPADAETGRWVLTLIALGVTSQTDSTAQQIRTEEGVMAWLPLVGTVISLISQKGIDAAQSAMLAMDETHQLMLQARQLQHQEAMDDRSEVFNEAVQERSERMRERSLLEDLDMADRKIDDKITKEWIGLIRGQ